MSIVVITVETTETAFEDGYEAREVVLLLRAVADAHWKLHNSVSLEASDPLLRHIEAFD